MARTTKTENGEGNRDGEWSFCQGKEVDIALFLQVTSNQEQERSENSSKQTSPLLPEPGLSQATNLEIQKKPDRSRATNHKSQNLTFCTRTNKRVFPKRFAKMIDGTEKPRIPSTSAKCAARYNKFGSNPNEDVCLSQNLQVYISSRTSGAS